MSRAISVKVATPKVIAALEAKLATMKTNKENEAINEKLFRENHKKWQKAVIKIALKQELTEDNYSVNARSWGNTHQVNLSYEITKSELPTEPTRDWEQMSDYQYKEAVEEIQNALNILRMTDEDYVPASTMKGISQYL
jgi:hypothetical protein